MKLSLSMIVKNEERFLPGCLESVKDLVDEIVIADTGSTDKTKEIALGFGAKIVDFPWRSDFSAARNEALRHTANDWVLYLDADERIDPKYHPIIRKLISSGKADALLLNLKSKIGTKDDAQYHLVAYPRVFRKLKGVRFTGEVHEQITPSLAAAGARILPSDVIIEHLGYAQDDEVILEKARRNRSLLLTQIEKRQNYGYALYQLGQTEIVLGETEAGLSHLGEALAAGGIGDSVIASIHGILAENLFKKRDYEAVILESDKSLAAASGQAFAHILKGDALAAIGRYQESVKEFSAALEQYQSGLLKAKVDMAIEPLFDIYILYFKLGTAALLAGDNDVARIYLEKAVRMRRTSHNVAKYFEALIKLGRFDELDDAAEEFKEFQKEDWYLRIFSSVMIDRQDFAGAAELLERISDQDVVSYISLANCRMKTDDFAGSESAFLKAIELGYDDPEGIQLLGLVQFRLLKFREAAETLSRVVDADPSNERAAKFLLAARAQAGLNTVVQ